MPAVSSDTPSQSSVAPGPQVPYPPYPFFVPQEDDEINLIDLLRMLWKRKWLIVLVTVLGASAAGAYALRATPLYQARAVIAPPEQKQSGGASAALAAFGGFGAEIAGSLGVSLGGADANRLEALLKSHRLIERVVEKNQLLPVLFEDDWDPAKKQWTVKDPEDAPNIWDAEKELEAIYRVKNNMKAGVLDLSFEFKDPETAVKILRHFLAELAVIMQEDELKKIEANRKFSLQQLKSATDPMIVAKLQSLLSEQVEKAMMAQNVGSFAYELIDPPAVSDQKVKPKRGLIAVLGFTAAAFLGVFLSLFIEWVQNMRLVETKNNSPETMKP
ncbi:MAG: Wzz/FepE/Etk N-terminal domain-containing protein [Deferrisomatales bacterium]|nr:Wzz/FepE/Etk N-terminal domain-containing protein [Deferrisomatales bacterium]